MKSSTPEVWFVEGIFQIQHPCAVNFSNNMSRSGSIPGTPIKVRPLKTLNNY